MRWPSGLLMSRWRSPNTPAPRRSPWSWAHRRSGPLAALAVGFAQRYATKAQRAALAVRDGNGCIHPGCIVPAHRCIAHHVRPWAAGGPTDLPNLVLVCCYHHRRIHHGRLHITQTPPAPTPPPTDPTGHRIEPAAPQKQCLGASDRPHWRTSPHPSQTEPVFHAAANNSAQGCCCREGQP